MAENTRLKELATAVERLSENNKQRDTREADHANRIRNVETSLDAIHRSIDALTRNIEHLSVSHPVNGAGGSDPRQQQPFHIRQVKLDFPRFGGLDPLNWLFRAEQFFTYYDTPRVLNSGAIARGVASTLRNRPRRHLEAWRAIRRH
ncbi:hypothetical protein Tco_0406208, partial [Tanacetum coccineum]